MQGQQPPLSLLPFPAAHLLDAQGPAILVPLDQCDWGLCLHGAADVTVDPNGNVDDGGHVHHAGRIWDSSSSVLALGRSPSAQPPPSS